MCGGKMLMSSHKSVSSIFSNKRETRKTRKNKRNDDVFSLRLLHIMSENFSFIHHPDYFWLKLLSATICECSRFTVKTMMMCEKNLMQYRLIIECVIQKICERAPLRPGVKVGGEHIAATYEISSSSLLIGRRKLFSLMILGRVRMFLDSFISSLIRQKIIQKPSSTSKAICNFPFIFFLSFH